MREGHRYTRSQPPVQQHVWMKFSVLLMYCANSERAVTRIYTIIHQAPRWSKG